MENADFYKELLDKTYEGIYFVDKDRQITFWNKAAEMITGYSSQEVLGKHCYNNILDHIDAAGCHLCMAGCPLHKTITDGVTRTAEVFLHHKLGHRVPVSIKAVPITEGGRIIGAAELFVDSTQRQEESRRIEKYKNLALVDQLTGLPNRRYIDTFLASKLSEYISFHIPFGILFVDVDEFKNFNDTYGHKIGDEILTMVSKTCSGITCSTDLFGRFGGDEFIAILTGTNESNIILISESMRSLVGKHSFGDLGLQVSISVGATLVNDNDSIASILKRADDLLFESKKNGRNRITYG